MQGMKTVEVCSVGIDAFVVFIRAFYELVKTQSSADIILVAFGTEQLQIFNTKIVCNSLGNLKSRVCTVFHAVTGCDVISAFNFKGKKSVWHAWQAFEEATDTFVCLSTIHIFLM